MYTKGEWKATDKKGVPLGLNEAKYMVENGQSLWICIASSKEDANLISAAPDMYEALKAIVEWIHNDKPLADLVPDIRAAIAKTEGK